MRCKWLFLVFILIGLAFPGAARADGIIIPEPPICIDGPCPPPPCPMVECPPPTPMSQLVVRYHRVNVTIEDGIAVTHVDQVFYNPNDYAVEGVYVFPLPPDAAVSAFTLWVDGKPVEGQVLDAQQARQTYEEIVRSLKDPALLEYAGRGALQASIFPIPPQGERRIELEYSQALAAENGLVRYSYPLNTEKFSLWPLENVSVRVEVRSSQPIRAVYSPTHPVAVSRESRGQATAGYEDAQVRPDSDFVLYYSLGEEQAFHLLTYREPGAGEDEDGFFLLLLAPRPDAAAQTMPKDVILVLDRSGSMEGEKFSQAQEALRYILGHLNPEDRFNLITFSTGVETYARGLQPAQEVEAAVRWVDGLNAQGSTDINRALLEAAALFVEAGSRKRPAYLIFLTDGLPTGGVVDSQQILDNFQAAAPEDLRLFAFGVGYDVDTFLLDSLAQGHHGTSSYVLPGERLDETLSAFYAKVSTPVLTGLELDFGSLSAYDLYPMPLPDLFAGSQLVVVGRYREGGAADVTLSGEVNGQLQTFTYEDQLFDTSAGQGERPPVSEDLQSALPRLWATRKIGYLLNQIRLRGPDQETIDQVVKLSIRYGIITPYTSYLVTEPQPLGAAEQERIAGEQLRDLQAQGPAPASGQAAVEKAADQGAMAGAGAPAARQPEAAEVVRSAGSRTFVYSGEVWTDTGFDPDRMQTVKVAFLSPDYFALAEARPELAAAFALGQRVIALSEGEAYEVVEAGEQVPALDLPPAPAVPPTSPVAPTQEEALLAASPLPPTRPPASQPAAAPSSPPAGEPQAQRGIACPGSLLAAGLLPLAALAARRRKIL